MIKIKHHKNRIDGVRSIRISLEFRLDWINICLLAVVIGWIFLLVNCAGLKKFTDWEQVDVVFPWMADMGDISAITGRNVNSGIRYNMRQVRLYIGYPLAVVDVAPAGNYAAAWRTDSPKYKYFVGYFSRSNYGDLLVGFSYDLEAEPELQLRANSVERKLLSEHLKGIKPIIPRCRKGACGI